MRFIFQDALQHARVVRGISAVDGTRRATLQPKVFRCEAELPHAAGADFTDASGRKWAHLVKAIFTAHDPSARRAELCQRASEYGADCIIEGAHELVRGAGGIGEGAEAVE